MLDLEWQLDMDPVTFDNLDQEYRIGPRSDQPCLVIALWQPGRSSVRGRVGEWGALGSGDAWGYLNRMPTVPANFDLFLSPNVDPLWAAP